MTTTQIPEFIPTPTPAPGTTPRPAYEEIGPNVYRHVVTNEIVMATDILTFAESNPQSELHTCFEWDDSRAGTLFRLQQVRELLLNTLTIRPDGEPDLQTLQGE